MAKPRNTGARYGLYQTSRPSGPYWYIQISHAGQTWAMALPFIPEDKAVTVRDLLRHNLRKGKITNRAQLAAFRASVRARMMRIGWTYSCKGGAMPAPR